MIVFVFVSVALKEEMIFKWNLFLHLLCPGWTQTELKLVVHFLLRQTQARQCKWHPESDNVRLVSHNAVRARVSLTANLKIFLLQIRVRCFRRRQQFKGVFFLFHFLFFFYIFLFFFYASWQKGFSYRITIFFVSSKVQLILCEWSFHLLLLLISPLVLREDTKVS